MTDDRPHDQRRECDACGDLADDTESIALPTSRDEPPDGYDLCRPCFDQRRDHAEAAAEARAEARRYDW